MKPHAEKPVLGMMRHGRGTGGSVGFYFDTLAQGLAQHFRIERLPEYFYQLDIDGMKRLMAEFLPRCDLLHATNGGVIDHVVCPFWTRRQLGLRLPILYQPLGEFPRGAAGFRAVLRFFREGDAVSFSSSADRGIYRRLVQACAARDVLQPFGVDTAHFCPRPAAETAAFRRHLGIPEEDILFTYVGRITHEKNVHGLLCAFARLLQRVPQARLLVLGEVNDTRFHEFGSGPHDLKALIRALPLGNAFQRIRFFGGVSPADLPVALSASDAFVSLTLHHDENFGYAQVEAMACGLPVVATRWGGLRDTIQHGVTGLHVPVHVTEAGVRIAIEDAVAAMEHLAGDAVLRQRMGQAGRARVLAHFDLAGHVEGTAALLQELSPGGEDAPEGANRFSTLGERLLQRAKEAASRSVKTDHGYMAAEPLFRVGEPSHAIYQEIIEPYTEAVAGAERPVTAAARQDREAPAAASPRLAPCSPLVQLEADQLVVHDPLWPGRFALDENEQEVMKAVLEGREPEARGGLLGGLFGRGRSPAAVASLLARGLVLPVAGGS